MRSNALSQEGKLARSGLGARAVHVPFHITWQHAQLPEETIPADGWRRIAHISELGEVLAEL